MRASDLHKATTLGMNAGSDFGEYERIGVLVARQSSVLAMAARRGYAEHGRGAVFYCEGWASSLPAASPFYLPVSEPEFADVGADIEQAVALYRPSLEGVVVVVTPREEVYVVRLRLPPIQDGDLGTHVH